MLLLLCAAAGLVRRDVSRDVLSVDAKGKGKEGMDKGLLIFIVLILFVFVAILVGLLVFSLKQMQKGTAQPERKDTTNTKPSGNPNELPIKSNLSQKNLKSPPSENDLLSETKPQTENNSLNEREPQIESQTKPQTEHDSLRKREASIKINLSPPSKSNSLSTKEEQKQQVNTEAQEPVLLAKLPIQEYTNRKKSKLPALNFAIFRTHLATIAIVR